jgi:threonine synthase
MWRYWRLLPIDDPSQIVTLREGATPLLPSRSYADRAVFLKDETRNPTGSHKDRPLAVALTHARSLGAAVSFVISTGSTGISNAAYAARAGLRSVVIMTEGVPDERIYPMYALGSHVLAVAGDIDPLIDQVIDLCRAHHLYLSATARSANPYQGEGNKTIAYELVDELGRAPDWVVVPVGGGGTLAGLRRGFQDLIALGHIQRAPRLVGVVPRDYNALEVAFQRNLTQWEQVLDLPFHALPPSILVKLAHAYPPDGMEALEAARASGGFFISVTDEEALVAQDKCARDNGMYVEPSTGACLAGLDRLLASGDVATTDTVVALVSGSGFRENFLTMQRRPIRKQSVPPDQLAELLPKLGL